jgi:transposase-like protein
LAKRHNVHEIKEKLATVARYLAFGVTQVEISSRMGVSIMTLHRWRKKAAVWSSDAAIGELSISTLKLENARLREIATSLSLEILVARDRLSLVTPIF